MTSNILMIRPVQFAYNAETAVNNSFQVASNDASVQEKALQEFDAFVAKLQAHGIDVTVVQDTAEPHTPDSIFPNNWISFHSNGSICLYPMFAVNRRQERKQHVLDAIDEKFVVDSTIDFTGSEANHLFLEGTGSMVLDREKQIAYACLSPRTDKGLLELFCKQFDYTPVAFIANDENGSPIYHTNVMMCVADQFVVICLASITNDTEKNQVVQSIENSGKTIIDISFHQMNHFAGNMLQVCNQQGNAFLVMSSQAYHSLTSEQIATIESYQPIIHADIATIETNGGGSARCMMAEVFLTTRL
ncbi:citrulline utilization hydrolase CtlX [Parasediminibacterium paludis]|uniref:Citrulline utilization hydrolase CtlX n=1 Tax=Parasediminibacterium paludis TaxID=908966 RepID=A0ABV8PYZ1_9BACT